MSQRPSPDPAVLVVGAGPVGLVLACELARRDVPVRIVDRLPEPTAQSRAIMVHARSQEALERLGALDELVAAGITTTGMRLYAGGREIAEIGLTSVDSPFPCSISIAQTATERILTERLNALGVSVERGVELRTFTQDDDGVDAVLVGPGGSEEHVRSRWLAGTDGARSTVRAGCGDQLSGSFVGERIAMGDVEAEHDLNPSAMHTFFSEDGPLLVFPLPDSRMRVMAQLTERSPAINEAPTLEQLQQLADERGQGTRLRLTAAHWLTVFEIHHAQVSSYRHGHAFLLGDAAHVHSPAGGQGMNTGMQDAFNLGWKLAAALEGIGGEALLDSFDAERRPVARRVIEQTTRLTNAGTLHAPWAKVLRDHAVRLGSGLAPVQHAIARQIEETDIAYRASPVVAGRGLHDGPRPGDAAPDVAGTGLRASLLAAPPEAHVAVTVAGHDGTPAALAPDERLWQVLVAADGAPAEGFDAVVADGARAVAHRYGIDGRGGMLIVRPDGYLGLIAELGDTVALERWFAALR
jgi:2-polyprenyl-6-methoxyphenol hydroxylase-like FAD-dependent oxidoreductase